MPITNIREPKWQSADHSVVDVVCDVLAADGETVVKGAASTLLHDHEAFADVAAGKHGAVAPYVPPLVDYALAINATASQIIDLPYMGRRGSVNNYFAQLATLKASGTIKPDQQTDLDALMAAATWEQTVIDHRDVLLKTPDQKTAEAARDLKSWPAFPQEAAAVVATC